MPKVYNKHHKDAPKDASYVGRPSKYGNPCEIGKTWGTREDVVKLYANWIQSQIEKGNLSLDEIKHDLGGRDLVCWCAPALCHADILLKLANGD